MTGHEMTVRHRIGESTGMRLQSAGCSCGWNSCCWYVNDEYVRTSHEMHINAIEQGLDVPSLLPPERQS